ncbi:MAG: alpha-amylase domain-containing protein [Halapricum sp.]
MKGIGGLGAAAAGWSLTSGTVEAAIGDSAIYQYYHTDWTTITDNLAAVADAGYDAIQVPPAQFSRLYEYERQANAETYDQPLGYQPIDYTNFDSVFGTEAEYQAMVTEAHNQGLEVIADAVTNHMAAGGDYFDRKVTLDDLPYFSSQDFHDQCTIDYSDPASVENCWLVGLRDLKQESSYVRGQLKNYIQKYADLGVDGIRWDAAKHIPEWFFSDYGNVWTDDLGLYSVGEVLDGAVSGDQQYAETGMSVTDYALYYTMKEDVFHSGGDMTALDGAGLVGQDPTSALTFVSNHDSAPPEYERLAYAFVLTYEGYPRVYNHRIGIADSDISNLLWIRRNVLSGPASTRHVDSNLYVFERGDGLVAINIGSSSQSQWVETGFGASTELADCTGTTGNVTTNSDAWVQLTVPAQSYVVYSTACVDSGGSSGGSGGDTSGTTLQIQAPTAPGESVFFTGSSSDLTSWDGGVEGTNTGGDTWEVTIQDTGSFDWKVRRGPSGGSGDVWESGDNHTSADTAPSFNGWSDGYTGGSSGTTLQIQAPTASGESVFFTGSSSDLTSWGGGVEGTNTSGDIWEVTIPDTGSFDWKVRRGPSGGSGDVWESGSNHSSSNTAPTFNGWSDGYTG